MKNKRLLIIVIFAAILSAALVLWGVFGGSETSTESAAPTESAMPTESAVPTESVVPTESAAPTESAVPTESAAPTESAMPTESTAPTESAVAVNEEPSETAAPLICTMSISCATILSNRDKLAPEKAGIIPSDGVIYAERSVEFDEGETVFDLLLRETRANKIHMEYVDTPAYNSAYIEGIANIYEFDCGSLSGWIYRVNGVSPGYGCSRYVLKNGDRVEWIYSCDLGRDAGAEAIQ